MSFNEYTGFLNYNDNLSLEYKDYNYNISDLCLEIIMLVKTLVLGYRLIRLTGVLTDSARREIVSVLGTSQVPVVLNYQWPSFFDSKKQKLYSN